MGVSIRVRNKVRVIGLELWLGPGVRVSSVAGKC